MGEVYYLIQYLFIWGGSENGLKSHPVSDKTATCKFSLKNFIFCC